MTTGEHLRGVVWAVLYIVGCLLMSDETIAQPQEYKVYRIVAVLGGNVVPASEKGLRDGLTDLGYIENRNFIYQILHSQDPEKLRAVIQGHGEQKPDLFVTFGEAETAIVKEAARTFPIVFLGVAAPLDAGFVKSLTKPATNLTGIAFYRGPGDHAKKLEILKEAVPTLKRAIILYDQQKENVTESSALGIIKQVARHLGIRIVERPVRSAADAERTISSVPKRMAGILPICRGIFWDIKAVASMAIKRGLPLSGCSKRQTVEDRVLIAYAPDVYRIGRRGAWYVHGILHGAKPQDLPVETPLKFELTVNVKTADAIGLKIPPEVLQRADKVIR